jgi:hypothetical protein
VCIGFTPLSPLGLIAKAINLKRGVSVFYAATLTPYYPPFKDGLISRGFTKTLNPFKGPGVAGAKVYGLLRGGPHKSPPWGVIYM